MLFPILSGGLLGGFFVLISRAGGRARENQMLAAGLVAAAVIYLGAAGMVGAPSKMVLLEVVGVAIFGAIAWLGLRRSLWWLAFGWLAHVGWDVGLHLDQRQEVVAAWYPLLCVGFDLIVAGYLLGAASSGQLARAG
jgi:hypothetical protein